MFDELGGKFKPLLRIADRATERNFGGARLVVATHHHQLPAGEQVVSLGRIDAIHDRRRVGLGSVESELDRHVGQHGRADARVQAAHPGFDVLVRPHILAVAEVFADQPVQQPAVDVVANAEGKQTGPHAIGGLRRRDDF